MTDTRELAVTQAKVARMMFEQTGHNKVAPTVHFRKEGHRDIAMVMKGVTSPLYDAVQKVIAQLPWVPDSVCVMADSFSMIPEAGREYAMQVAAGTNKPLSQLFRQGDPRVKEACNTIVLTAERTVTVNQTYRWTPADGWEWDEPVILDSKDEGNYSTDWEFERLVTLQPRRDITDFVEE